MTENDDKLLENFFAEKRQELFNLRFQHGTAQLEKTSGLKAGRRDIARILTVLKEKE